MRLNKASPAHMAQPSQGQAKGIKSHIHERNVPKRCCGHSKAVHCALLGQSTISSTSGSPEGVYPQQELLLSVPLTPQSPKSHLPVSYLIPLAAVSAGVEGDPTEQRPGTKKRQEV